MSLNIDPKEVSKFESMAADWWNPDGVCKPLHALNPLRLKFIEENVVLSHKKVLDIGCGGGILTESMARRGAVVTGIDVSSDIVRAAKDHALNQALAIDYFVTTAEELVEKAGPHQFDLITCMEILEHVPDPAVLISACSKLLKPHGEIFFSTISRTAKAYLFSIIGAEYLLKLLPINTHSYASFIKPSELSKMARSHGLLAKKFKGIFYNPLTRTYGLNEDVSVNYLAYYARS